MNHESTLRHLEDICIRHLTNFIGDKGEAAGYQLNEAFYKRDNIPEIIIRFKDSDSAIRVTVKADFVPSDYSAPTPIRSEEILYPDIG